jgi:serine/threonine protein kinase
MGKRAEKAIRGAVSVSGTRDYITLNINDQQDKKKVDAQAPNTKHPNIVAIHEVGEQRGQHYFTMDYVAGLDLGAVVKGGSLPPYVAARYVKIIAEAIHFAHQRGTLHRDLKPQNVLIDSTDQPRITDFGLAKIMKDDSGLTQSGIVAREVRASDGPLPRAVFAARFFEQLPLLGVAGGDVGVERDPPNDGRATPALAPQRPTIREKSAAEILANLRGVTLPYKFRERVEELYLGRWTRESGWQVTVQCLPSKRSGGVGFAASGKSVLAAHSRRRRVVPLHCRPRLCHDPLFRRPGCSPPLTSSCWSHT